MMGLWFLASAFGQLAAGKLGAAISQSNGGTTLMSKLQSYTDGYYTLAIYALVAEKDFSYSVFNFDEYVNTSAKRVNMAYRYVKSY